MASIGTDRPLSSNVRVPALGQGSLERAQAVLGRGDDRPLLIKREHQRTYVRVASRQGDDLRVELHESIQSGGGGSQARLSRWRDQRSQRGEGIPSGRL